MNNKDTYTEYKNEFLKRFIQNKIFKEEESVFSNIFGKAQWWVFSSANRKTLLSELRSMPRAVDKKAACSHINKVKKEKKPIVFKCDNFYCVCAPLLRGDNIYGYLMISYLNSRPSDELLLVLNGFTNSIIEEVSKEIELSKLYEVIRPRAIALSTIHTIHRLIGSTLDINELLPRIGRLALQVLRAGHIEIYMKDRKTGKLNCVAAINYAESKDFYKISKKYANIAKTVIANSRSVSKKNLLAMPLIEEEDILGVIIIKDRIDKKNFTIFDQEILNTLAEQAVVAIKNAQMYKEQQDITIGSIKSLASLLDLKLPGAYTHTSLFVELILALGREMALSQEEMRDLHYSALLPDLGKVFVPEQILKKPAPLDKRELHFIREHTKKAVEIMQHLSGLKSTIPIILHHHEWYDGTGYPNRLQGDNIPAGARIMAVGDAFEAMLRKRPHKERLTLTKTVMEIKSQANTQFDPKVVNALLHLYHKGTLKSLLKGHMHEFKKVF